MKVSSPRSGDALRVRGRELPFSYFPVGRAGRRKAVYDSLFATSPWAVMSGEITHRLSDEDQRAEALAFLDQARQFYATAGTYQSANPLLYYYAFLNLAKPLIRLRGYTGSLESAKHGIYTERRPKAKGNLPASFQVTVEGPKEGKISVFAELSKRLGCGAPKPGPHLVEDLMPQVVVGHRLWRQATAGREHFIALRKVEMIQDHRTSEMWLRLLILRENFGRFGLAHTKVLKQSGLHQNFREVKGGTVPADCVAFEQRVPVNYGQHPTDFLDRLVDAHRDHLWRIVSADPEQGYRRYYLHLAAKAEGRLPQLLSIWALLFHYGSLVRYQPHVYAAMTRDKYGAFIQEFVAAQPEQLLYLFASELCQREVAKPAIA
jgi:hypothetical protein